MKRALPIGKRGHRGSMVWIAGWALMLVVVHRPVFAIHPTHASLSEVRWDVDRKCFECSLRLQFEDVRRLIGPGEELPDAASIEQRLRVVTRVFRVLHKTSTTNAETKPDRERPAPIDTAATAPTFDGTSLTLTNQTSYRWIGSEDVRGYAWWHFEIHPSPDSLPATLRIELSRSLDRDHRHRLTWIQTDPPIGFDLTEAEPELPLTIDRLGVPQPSVTEETTAK